MESPFVPNTDYLFLLGHFNPLNYEVNKVYSVYMHPTYKRMQVQEKYVINNYR